MSDLPTSHMLGGVTQRLPDQVRRLLEDQVGVVSRRQVLELGLGDHDVRRLLRRREWHRVHEGVYVDHSGRLDWQQRAWAAVLACWPAALSHESARRGADGPGRASHHDRDVIHVAIDRDRVLASPDGVRLHRLADLHGKVHWNTAPPRQRVEEAVIDLAAEAATELDAVAHLSDALRARLTTGERLSLALGGRSRIARRAFLEAMIADVIEGTCSTLEHGYLDLVERPHGLPTGRRQVRDSLRGPVYRDVEYEGFGVIVELDGRLHHSSVADRDRDLDRDLDAAVDGRVTVRLGWGQAFERPCLTATRVGVLLSQRGWTGSLVTCPACDPDSGVQQSPGDSDPPLSA